jgi:hypothetical protein
VKDSLLLLIFVQHHGQVLVKQFSSHGTTRASYTKQHGQVLIEHILTRASADQA